MKKIILPAIVLFCVAASSSCGSGESSAAKETAYGLGHRDAIDAMARDSASMDRERGVFAIRARESELRRAGLEECADAYARGAYEVIDSVLKAENALR